MSNEVRKIWDILSGKNTPEKISFISIDFESTVSKEKNL